MIFATNQYYSFFCLVPLPRRRSGVCGVPYGRGQPSRLTLLVRPLLLYAHHTRTRQPGTVYMRITPCLSFTKLTDYECKTCVY